MAARAARDVHVDATLSRHVPGSAPVVPGATQRLIELLHPDGHARTIGAADTAADVLFLELTSRQSNVHTALERLTPDSVAFVQPPRWRRHRTAAELRAAGYGVGPMLLRVPDATGDRFLVPLERRALRLLAQLSTDGALAAAVLDAALAVPAGPRVLAETLNVGFVAWRAGARTPLEWLARAGVAGADAAGVVIARGWRGADDTVLLHVIAGDGGRRAVVKVARAGGAAGEDELLETVGAGARAAGMAVPSVLGATVLGPRRAVGLSFVPGATAAVQVRRRPAEALRVLDRLGAWLEVWNRTTVQHRSLGEAQPDLLDVLDVVMPRVAGSAPYAQAVRALAHSLADMRLPLVAAHNDLTLYNVRLDGAGDGVLDWEAATAAALPLTDLEYAAVDVVAAAAGYRDRVEAWRRCFHAEEAVAARRSGGVVAARFRALRARSTAVLQLPPTYVELCHHVGWLRHAANEQRAGGGSDGPFLGIVGELVRRGVSPHG